MPKLSDYEVRPEVTDIMEQMIEGFPNVFEGFDVNLVLASHTKGKENDKKPLRLVAVKYPHSVMTDTVYIIEVMDDTWMKLSQKQKNLAVFHIMCSVPPGAFDPESKKYAGKRKPDYEIFAEEFAVSGGIPNWLENDVESRDPIDVANGDVAEEIERKAVTKEDIAAIHAEACPSK